jgi:hypothetical protein
MYELALKQPMLLQAAAGISPVAHGGKVEIVVR